MSKKHLGQLFYELFWIFFIGCFLGVVIESIWCVLTRGYYESRSGLIYGPFNLIYGFGALLMTIGLNPLQHKKDKTIFFFGFIVIFYLILMGESIYSILAFGDYYLSLG